MAQARGDLERPPAAVAEGVELAVRLDAPERAEALVVVARLTGEEPGPEHVPAVELEVGPLEVGPGLPAGLVVADDAEALDLALHRPRSPHPGKLEPAVVEAVDAFDVARVDDQPVVRDAELGAGGEPLAAAGGAPRDRRPAPVSGDAEVERPRALDDGSVGDAAVDAPAFAAAADLLEGHAEHADLGAVVRPAVRDRRAEHRGRRRVVEGARRHRFLDEGAQAPPGVHRMAGELLADHEPQRVEAAVGEHRRAQPVEHALARVEEVERAEEEVVPVEQRVGEHDRAASDQAAVVLAVRRHRTVPGAAVDLQEHAHAGADVAVGAHVARQRAEERLLRVVADRAGADQRLVLVRLRARFRARISGLLLGRRRRGKRQRQRARDDDGAPIRHVRGILFPFAARRRACRGSPQRACALPSVCVAGRPGTAAGRTGAASTVPCRTGTPAAGQDAGTVPEAMQPGLVRMSGAGARRRPAGVSAPRGTAALALAGRWKPSFFDIFKRGMKSVYQHCAREHLHRYAAEFEFRYNNQIANGVDDARRAAVALWGATGKRFRYADRVL